MSARTVMLTNRQLARATLARQMLLERADASPLTAIERLVGLQAQQARPPFIGLWSRLREFDREDLLKLIRTRRVVRATMMRATLHLMSARDYGAFRPVLQPMLTATFGLSRRLNGTGMPELLASAERFMGREARTFEALRQNLLAEFPSCDARALAYGVRLHLPLVQVPRDEHGWGYHASAEFITARTWLNAELEQGAAPHEFVLRYLAAFGPASVADARAWSGLRGLASVFDELRPRLREFRDETGRTLFDLPKAPRPDEDTPAPVRFLPDYDNLVLAHADRGRFMPDSYRRRICMANLRVLPTLLVDGRVVGTWDVSRAKRQATLTIEPYETISSAARDKAVEEGEALLRFVEPEAATREVRFLKSPARRDATGET